MITATATDRGAVITIRLGGVELENGSSATWESGENTVSITVSNGNSETIYSVIVTKTA